MIKISEKDFKKFIELAKEFGASETRIIPSSTVKTAGWVRMKCQYGCDGFGSGLCCPPYTPTPQEFRETLNDYQNGLLIHCQPGTSVTEIIRKLEREIFLSGYYKALGFGAGSCNLCDPCNLERCLYPNEARPSMEACGIDVYATARQNDFPIEVLKDYSCKGNYYGLILID